jgi:hypothetical protein
MKTRDFPETHDHSHWEWSCCNSRLFPVFRTDRSPLSESFLSASDRLFPGPGAQLAVCGHRTTAPH